MNITSLAHESVRTSGATPLRAGALTRLAALGTALLATVGLSLAAATPALAHDELVGVSAVGSAESGEAPGIQLDFNNDIMDMGSELIGTAADGSSLLDGLPTVEGRSVTQLLVPGLDDGTYSVAWRVVSSDGHPIQGQLDVTMAEGYVSEVSVADATEEPGSTEEPADDGAGEATEGATDDEPIMTTQGAVDSEQADGGTNPAIWITLAVIAVVAAGAVGATIAMKKRKQNGSDEGAAL